MAYTGPSIVDYLKSIGQPSDFASRSRLAAQHGITNYTGTATQNTQLLGILRTQASPSPSPTPTPAPAPAQSSYAGSSIVDYLKSIGQASDFSSRSRLAAQAGITNYTGTAAQNTALLNHLRAGTPIPSHLGTPKPAETPTTPTTQTVEPEREPEPKPRPEERAVEDTRLPRTNVNIGGVSFSLPVDLVQSPFFKQASDEVKSMMAYSWQAIADQGYDLQKVIQALDTAATQTDAYMRQQIRMFEDELARSFGYIIDYYGAEKQILLRRISETKEDLEITERLLARRAEELEEDLTYYSGELGIDKQRALSQSLRDYELRLENTREQMAEMGLTASTIRSRAEQLLKEAHEDIVEDIQTKHARQIRELEVGTARKLKDIELEKQTARIGAARDTMGFEEQKDRLLMQSQQNILDILRRGETYLGSEKMGQLLPGFGQLPFQLGQQSLLGGITATGLAKDTQQDILQRAQAFLSPLR